MQVIPFEEMIRMAMEAVMMGDVIATTMAVTTTTITPSTTFEHLPIRDRDMEGEMVAILEVEAATGVEMTHLMREIST